MRLAAAGKPAGERETARHRLLRLRSCHGHPSYSSKLTADVPARIAFRRRCVDSQLVKALGGGTVRILPLMWGLAAVQASVVVALVSAAASLIVAVIAQVASRRTSVRLARLEEERAERSARRDYAYDARKRLYTECEPLLFQAAEFSETARAAIVGLARSARNGWINSDGSGWLAAPDYYFTITVYQLLAPATTFRMLQSRLTVVDLSLDERVRGQYELVRLLFFSFTWDFDLASSDVSTSLPYEPDRTDPGEPGRGELLTSCPERYARQGLYRGVLDVIADSMIVRDDDAAESRTRCVTFGEFLRAWTHRGSDLRAAQPTLLDLFAGFHPQRKPVLWRVLVAQYLLHGILLRGDPLASPSELPEAEAKALDWRPADGRGSESETVGAIRAAEENVATRLAEASSRIRRAHRGSAPPT